MKKVFTSLFLLMFGVMASHATLKVAGVVVSSTGNVNAGQSQGTINWDGSALTFTDVSLSTSDNVISYDGTSSLYVKFVGSNVLESTAKTVLFSYHANMYLYGDLCAGASAKVVYSGSGTGYPGIYVRDGNQLTIHDLYLTVENSITSCLVAESGFDTSKLSVYTAVLKLTTGASDGAIRGFASTFFDGGDAYLLNGVYYDATNRRSCNSDGTVAGTVTTGAPLFVGGGIVGIGYSTSISLYPNGLTAGNISYEHSSKTLSFDAVKITVPTAATASETRVVYNKDLEGLTILFNGNNTLETQTKNVGSVIKTEKKLTIKGEGVDLGKLATLKGNIGIYAPSSEVTIDNASVFADAGYGIIGTESGPMTLNIKDAFVAAKGTVGSMYNMANCNLTNVQVYADIAPGVCFRKALKGFGTATEVYKDVIWILPWSTDYNVTVLGEKVTDLNLSNIAVDGLTEGTISYDKDNKVLTLDGVEMTAPEGTDFIGVNTNVNGYTVSTIALTGTNKLTTNGHVFALAGDVTFEGNGSLIATSNNGSGVSMYRYNNNASLTINVNNTVKFFGKKYGVWGNATSSTTSDLILKKAGNNSDYYFQGTTTAAVKEFGNLTMTNMDFYSGSTYGTPGCYFDDEAVRQNGGNIVNGDKVVNFYRLNDGDRYGIKIGGVEITNCNKFGVGSKYITAGGGNAVKYDNSSKELTLNDATIDNQGDDKNCIRNEEVDNLTINVASNSTLTSTSSNNWGTIYSEKAVTITGSGKLTVNGTRGNISVAGGSMTFKDVNVSMTGELKGYTSSGNNYLYVDLAKGSGKRVEIAGKVYDFTDMTLRNGTKILEPEGAWYDTSNKYVTTGSGAAEGIVFADMDATGIEGVMMNADVKVIGIFDTEGRQLDEMQPGVNILRMSDGTTKKIIKK